MPAPKLSPISIAEQHLSRHRRSESDVRIGSICEVIERCGRVRFDADPGSVTPGSCDQVRRGAIRPLKNMSRPIRTKRPHLPA
jgi:hypothetical protein